MNPTALVYSSHNRSDYLHNNFIVQRALNGWADKRILFLPMSETVQNGSELERQEFSWGTFEWFFRFYERYGLKFNPFYWRSNLRKEDVDLLWHALWNTEVVILGGGNPATGLWRYKDLGARFDGEPGKFGRLLHERAQRGLLTVGFSAGADQMCEYLFGRTFDRPYDTDGFGMLRNTMVTLHHQPGDNHDLWLAANRFRHCMVFGLPNDSGIAEEHGWLPSGNHWQVMRFIVDKSWDLPRDQWHIRTRAGALVEHVYADGRTWGFHDGDMLVRIQSADNHFHDAWIISGGTPIHYWTHQRSRYGSIGEILGSH